MALGTLGIYIASGAIARADGSRFTVEYCDPALPAGNPPAWTLQADSARYFAVFQTCATPGGALGLTQSSKTIPTPGQLDVAIPETPGGFVESETISASLSLHPQGGYVYAPEWPANDTGDIARFFHLRDERGPLDNGGGFAIVLNCGPAEVICARGQGSIEAHDIAATEVDLVPPSLPKTEGTLLAGGELRGHQSLTAEASDVGGGISRIEALVDGLPAAPPMAGACGVLQVTNASSSYRGPAAISPTPCPPKLAASWSLDTASYPFQNGTNSVQVCASDLATVGSPNTTCSRPQTVSVDNSCSDSPVGGGETLSATFAGSGSEQVTVPFGRAAELRGELADSAGDPILGATICIEAQTEGTVTSSAPVATAKTDARGQFNYEISGGPNRRVLVAYRHDSFQVARTIRYFARARPTLRLRPGRTHTGGRIQINGRLPGPKAAGRVVVLQASALHGRRWITFRRATTGPRGFFGATYRFGSTTTSITYRIRAVVPEQNGYPYAAGHSKPARVKIQAGHR